MASKEPSGYVKPSPPTPPPTRPTTSQEPQTRRGVEWSRLLTNTGDTGAVTPAAAPSDAELASRDHEGTISGKGGLERRFDLGSEGEGGRKPWYVPTERTVFPVKKGEGRKSHLEERKKVVVPVVDEERVEDDVDVLRGTTEEEVESAMRRGEVGGKGLRLRTRRSLEEDILGIEDEESRRLTAIAYLS